jgi:hypothetical protein
MSDQPHEMIPRVTVRDADDAELLLFALRDYMHGRLDFLTTEARKPKADQYALSVQQIQETENVTALMTSIVDGMVDSQPTADEGEHDGKDS